MRIRYLIHWLDPKEFPTAGGQPMKDRVLAVCGLTWKKYLNEEHPTHWLKRDEADSEPRDAPNDYCDQCLFEYMKNTL